MRATEVAEPAVRAFPPGSRLAALRAAGLDFFTGVPDSEIADLVADLEADGGEEYAPATREDNAVGLAVGAHLAGRRPLVFMESSGVGTSLDAITSLLVAYRVPALLLVVWAGYEGRDVPHHNAIGEPLQELLSALRLPVTVIDDLGGPPAVWERVARAAVRHAQRARRPAVLLGVPGSLAATGTP